MTLVVWVVMLAENSTKLSPIKTNQIGWSLWVAVASTGGYLISLVLFCTARARHSLDKPDKYMSDTREIIIPRVIQ